MSSSFVYQWRGSVNAGWPSPAEEELGDTLSLDEWLLPRKEASFLLQARGLALQHRGILPGDTLIVERGRTPRRADIIAIDRAGVLSVDEYPLAQTHDDDEATTLIGVITAVVRKCR